MGARNFFLKIEIPITKRKYSREKRMTMWSTFENIPTKANPIFVFVNIFSLLYFGYWMRYARLRQILIKSRSLFSKISHYFYLRNPTRWYSTQLDDRERPSLSSVYKYTVGILARENPILLWTYPLPWGTFYYFEIPSFQFTETSTTRTVYETLSDPYNNHWRQPLLMFSIQFDSLVLLLLVSFRLLGRHHPTRDSVTSMDQLVKHDKNTPGTHEILPPEDGLRPPPPSPLSGGYLLIVISEPRLETHKSVILQKISKGKIYSAHISRHVHLLVYPQTAFSFFHLDVGERPSINNAIVQSVFYCRPSFPHVDVSS